LYVVIAGVESERVGEVPPVNVEPETEIVKDGCEKLPGWLVELPPLNVKFVFTPPALAVKDMLPPEADAVTGEPVPLRAVAKPEATEVVVSLWP
jgi:hypothetical protein